MMMMMMMMMMMCFKIVSKCMIMKIIVHFLFIVFGNMLMFKCMIE